MAPRSEPTRLERLPVFSWFVIAVVALCSLCAVLQVGLVRPYLWPAGVGATYQGDTSADFPLKARPPQIDRFPITAPRVSGVVEGGPVWAAGIRDGDILLALDHIGDAPVNAFHPDSYEAAISTWWRRYWMGVNGPVAWTVSSDRTKAPRTVTLERPPIWRAAANGWTRQHLGMIVQTVVFIGAAVLLLLLRAYDRTAGLCALAFAFSAVGGGGPLFGAERNVSFIYPLLTFFAWMASPLAFPSIALAILHFPSRSPMLDRSPWLHAVPL